jgi:membrane-associated phospholipid phosphatase
LALRSAALALAVAIATGTSPARADHLRWDEDWPRVRTAELATSGILVTAVVAGELFIVPDAPRWRGGVLLDHPVRDALRLEGGAPAAALASDVIVAALLGWPVLADDLGRVWAADENPDLAGQLFGVDALSLSVTAFLLSFTKNVVARERPWAAFRCQDDPLPDSRCDTRDRFRSFFSGHTAYAFTGASLVCVHHLNLPLYGGGWADDLACGVAIAAAATVGLLRIATDRHWLSDVLVGAIVGAASGLLLPAALHFGFDWSRDRGP